MDSETQDCQNSLRSGGQASGAVVPSESVRPLSKQHEAINGKLRGHYMYYGVTDGARAESVSATGSTHWVQVAEPGRLRVSKRVL